MSSVIAVAAMASVLTAPVAAASPKELDRARRRSRPRIGRSNGTLAHLSTDTLAAVARRLNEFEHLYNEIAEPFRWKLTRENLNDWLDRLDD